MLQFRRIKKKYFLISQKIMKSYFTIDHLLFYYIKLNYKLFYLMKKLNL